MTLTIARNVEIDRLWRLVAQHPSLFALEPLLLSHLLLLVRLPQQLVASSLYFSSPSPAMITVKEALVAASCTAEISADVGICGNHETSRHKDEEEEKEKKEKGEDGEGGVRRLSLPAQRFLNSRTRERWRRQSIYAGLLRLPVCTRTG